MKLAAGAAVRSINPPPGAVLFGYPHVERISTGVHDPLLASAVYLEDRRGGRLILITLDLLFLDPPTARKLRRAVSQRTSVPEAGVFISCTHTHSGPVSCRLLAWREDPAVVAPDQKYLEFMHQQAISAAQEALDGARPAELAWTTADASGAGGNRLATGGVTDSEVGILVVREQGGAPLAVGLVYGMHPTVLHEDSTLVSADFPHYARVELQRHLGQSLKVVYQTAPCGNQSPRRFVSGQTFQEAERLGRILGKAAAAALGSLADEDFARHGTLSGCLREVELPRRTWPSVDGAQRRLDECRAHFRRLSSPGDKFQSTEAENAQRAAVRTAQCAVFGAEAALVLARADQRGDIQRTLDAYRPIEVQLLRVGDVYLAGLPGELFAEYALEIKRRAPAKTFVVSLVGGELQGYIVTPQADAEGGYEAANSLFLPAAGRVMVNTVLSMIADAPGDPQ